MGLVVENEVKVLDIDVSRVRQRIEGLGGEKVFEGLVEDTFYTKEGCRWDKVVLRTMRPGGGEETYLVKKGRVPENHPRSLDFAKSMFCEVEQVERKKGEDRLRSEGWFPDFEIVKRRVKYVWGGAGYIVDCYPGGVPPLLEVEVENGSGKNLRDALGAAGFSVEKSVDWSCRKVLKYYCC